MIGQTISHYKILSKIGEGGMGIVYKAHDTTLDRTVALKFLQHHLTSDPTEKERFYLEAKTASALNHPNITTIYEIREHDDPKVAAKQIFIAMEYVEGQTLKNIVGSRHDSTLLLNKIMDVAIQICNGLAAAHEKGIVHRDIKSENIMVTPKGQVKIMDFGLAKLKGAPRITKTGSTLGTAAYMSPEQTRGEEIDNRSDIFSFGVVLYETLTGRLPFGGEHVAAIQYSIVNEDPFPVARYNNKVSPDLQHIITKALQKDRDERYQHIDDILADLRHERKNLEYARAGYVAPKAAETTSAPEEKKAESAGITQESHRSSSLSRMRKPLILVGIVAVLMTAFFIIKPLIFDEMLVSEPKPIAVIAFVNQTGDRAYDYLQDAIPNLLITSLEQSKYLRVMTWERMHDVLEQMGKGDIDRIDKELGFELCRREGIHAIVLGSYVKAGETFATDVKVLDVNTKELLKSTSARGEGIQSILNSQIDELSREISRGVGLSDRKIAVSSQQIASVTTNSMEAYSSFLKGREQYEKGYWVDCVPSLEQAVRLDSTFATAYLYLARAYLIRGNSREIDKNYQKAKALTGKVSEKERLYIEAYYASAIDKNPQKRFKILKMIADRFPKEKEIYFDLSVYYLGQEMKIESIDALNKALELDPNYGKALNQGAYVYARLGDYEIALEYLRKYAELNPGEPDPFDSMGDMYFYVGDMQAAITKYREAIAIKSDIMTYFKIAFIYGIQEDYPSALGSLDSFLKNIPPSIPLAGVRAWKSYYHYLMGERKQAVRDIDEAQKLWSSIENRYFIAYMDLLKAQYLLCEKDISLGINLTEKAVPILVEISPSGKGNFVMTLELFRGIVALKQGQIETASKQVAAMETQLPQVSSLSESNMRYLLTLYRGAVLLASGRTDSAIVVSRQAIATRPYSLDAPGFAAYISFSIYAPVRDVLARAYLQKGQIMEAIAEYERLARFDPQREDRRFICPEYHYYLAKLYEQSGQKDKAIQKYEKFLSIWKSADADIPELIDAKARLGKLKK